jgi:hypothetical protein
MAIFGIVNIRKIYLVSFYPDTGKWDIILCVVTDPEMK